jgi:uncharacterized membrane protein
MYNTNGFSRIMNYGVSILTTLTIFAVCSIFAYNAKKWNDITTIETQTKNQITESYSNVTNNIIN